MEICIFIHNLATIILHILLWHAFNSPWTIVNSSGDIQHAFLSIPSTTVCRQSINTTSCEDSLLWNVGGYDILNQFMVYTGFLMSLFAWYILIPIWQDRRLNSPVHSNRWLIGILVALCSSYFLMFLVFATTWDSFLSEWITHHADQLRNYTTIDTNYRNMTGFMIIILGFSINFVMPKTSRIIPQVIEVSLMPPSQQQSDTIV